MDLRGRQFGRWSVIRCAGRTKQRSLTWLCRCSCGTEKIVSGASLRAGTTKSCGCTNRRSKKHGAWHTRLYHAWTSMHDRCRNPNCPGFKFYGARGIKVCKAWQTFEPFRDWALAHGYKEGLSIDRINSTGNYTPSNCQWLTRSENSIKSWADRRSGITAAGSSAGRPGWCAW